MPMVQNKIMKYCYFAVKSHTPIPINFYRVNLNWQSKKTNQVNELSVKQKIQRKIPCGVDYLPYFDYFPRNGDHVKPNTQYLKNSKVSFFYFAGKTNCGIYTQSHKPLVLQCGIGNLWSSGTVFGFQTLSSGTAGEKKIHTITWDLRWQI